MYRTEELRNLDPERLELLAEALESGEYKKGQRRLAIKDVRSGTWKYCCMGVGSEIAIANGVDVPTDMSEEDEYVQVKRYAGNSAFFCAAVREWFGFIHENPNLPTPERYWRTMGAWNDDGPCGRPEPDFTTIAAAVRELARMAREARHE